MWYRQGSSKDGAGVLYFHLAAEGCFVAAAFYRPGPEVLSAIRERIRVYPNRFLAVQADLAASAIALYATDCLTRMPRGFEDLKDSLVAQALRLRSFLVCRDVPLEITTKPELVGAIVDFAKQSLPLLRFGWDAVDEANGLLPVDKGND